MNRLNISKILLWVGGVALIVWLGSYIITPPPGLKKEDQGRDHVSEADMAKFTYNSNPPTSGPHLVTWVKPGVYADPQSEGELIHSLEHGYINISYNCNAKTVSASPSQGSPSAQLAGPEASASARNSSSTCKTLITTLEELVRKKKLFKLLLVPRPSQTSTIALTAWTYIDTMEEYDEKRIIRFIDFHRDHGPEQTME